MWLYLSNEAQTTLNNLPLLLLQATSLMGILCALLIGMRPKEVSIYTDTNLNKVLYGVLLGCSSFMLMGLVGDEFMRKPTKIYLSHDLLFLAGLLGGWRSGSVTWALVLSGRWLFGGPTHALAAGVDFAVVTLGGIVLHHWVGQRRLTDITTARLFLLWLARTLFAQVGLFVLAVFHLVPESVLSALSVQRLFFAAPSLPLFYGIFTIFCMDAEHRRMVKKQLQLTQTDPFTKLPNRRALRDHLATCLVNKNAQATALLTIETENYIDMLLSKGHNWSDQVCQDIDCLLRHDYAHVTLAPYKPRVFQLADATLAIALHDINVADVEQNGLAVALFQDLTERLRSKAGTDQYPHLRMTVSDCNTRHYPSADSFLRDVSLRLQTLTNSGQSIHYWHQTFAQAAVMDAELLTMLVDWVDGNTPPMGYQPKCDLATRVVTGAEALLRARDSYNKPIAPQQILALAARHQLLAAFEWCTVEAVARDAARCITLGQHITLSVNISGASLTTPGFATRVHSLMTALALPMSSVTLELTETSALPDVESVSDNVRMLGEAGIQMSLDDFGTGYSGLTILARFPFSEVKIDYAMVALLEQPRMRSAIQIALESAQRYEATFVAEGVETQAQCDTLSAMGIGVGQGYLFSNTLPIDDLVAFAQSAFDDSVLEARDLVGDVVAS